MIKNREKWNMYMKQYRLKHIEKFRMRSKQRTDKRRKEILEILGNKCVRCGYAGIALQIDHVNGGGSKERIKDGSDKHYRLMLKRIQAGSKDYQLLCANCNWEKRHEKGETGSYFS
jgi:hypothetical protein